MYNACLTLIFVLIANSSDVICHLFGIGNLVLMYRVCQNCAVNFVGRDLSRTLATTRQILYYVSCNIFSVSAENYANNISSR